MLTDGCTEFIITSLEEELCRQTGWASPEPKPWREGGSCWRSCLQLWSCWLCFSHHTVSHFQCYLLRNCLQGKPCLFEMFNSACVCLLRQYTVILFIYTNTVQNTIILWIYTPVSPNIKPLAGDDSDVDSEQCSNENPGPGLPVAVLCYRHPPQPPVLTALHGSDIFMHILCSLGRSGSGAFWDQVDQDLGFPSRILTSSKMVGVINELSVVLMLWPVSVETVDLQ